MWPSQAEWARCWEYWFLHIHPIIVCNSFCILLFCHVYNLTKSHFDIVFFQFLKARIHVFYLILLQSLRHMFNQGWLVTHSAWSGHIRRTWRIVSKCGLQYEWGVYVTQHIKMSQLGKKFNIFCYFLNGYSFSSILTQTFLKLDIAYQLLEIW